MSIAECFESPTLRRPPALQARRQFEISLALVAVLAVASIGVGKWHDTASGARASIHADASFAGALPGAIPD